MKFIVLSVRNIAEERVIKALQRAVKLGMQGACSCPGCLSYLASRAINILPARYCQEYSFGKEAIGGITFDKVNEAIDKAKRDLDLTFPHDVPMEDPPRIAPLVNLVREETDLLLQVLKRTGKIPCQCNQCLSDILALTLNQFPNGYLAAAEKTNDARRSLMLIPEETLRKALEQSIKRISRRPNHSI